MTEPARAGRGGKDQRRRRLLSEGAVLPPGLRAGDGVFETLRTYGGVPFLLNEHLARLRRGAHAIGLSGVPSGSALREACEEALDQARRRGAAREWVLRPMLYASDERAGLRVDVDPCPPSPFPRRPQGLLVGISSYRHPGRYVVPPGATAPVKWLARGPLAHALRQAHARGWDEAILEDSDGRLIEGTRSNLLAWVDGLLVSPGPESYALAGITRSLVVRDARSLDLPVRERALSREELRSATEVMLTSSLLGVAPVRRIVGLWSERRPRARPIASRLVAAYQARLRHGE